MLVMATCAFAQEQETNIRVPSGYQGFLEEGNTWHFDKDMPHGMSLSTTHGFYFNGHIYVGVGIGIDWNKNYGFVPIYTNVRYQFNNTKFVSPIVSLRLGSYMGDDMGAYGDLAFGVRFASKRDFAVSVLLAGTYYDKIKEYDYYNDTNYKVSPSGISLRIGIEW